MLAQPQLSGGCQVDIFVVARLAQNRFASRSVQPALLTPKVNQWPRYHAL